MSTTPESGPLSRGQAASARLISRRVATERRYRRRRQGGRRPIPVQVVVKGENTSLGGVTFGILAISGVSPSFNSMARVRVAGLPAETSKLDSELNDIFSQLHDLDLSISNANQAISELRESTRSIIGEMLSKG
jgi:hypothetical protein